MLARDVQTGRVYLVWRSRKLTPVYIISRGFACFHGRVYPNGRKVTIKDARKISGEYKQMNKYVDQNGFKTEPVIDFKSRAAGERED